MDPSRLISLQGAGAHARAPLPSTGARILDAGPRADHREPTGTKGRRA